MNSNQTTIEDRSPSRLTQIRTFVRDRLIATVTVTIAGSLILAGGSTANIWSIYHSFQSIVAQQFELQKISDDSIYQEEALTMSARMLVTTGELQWEQRYQKFAAEHQKTIKQFLAKIPAALQTEASKTNAASDRLLAMEDSAFKLVKQGQQKEAYQLLMGDEYATQKKIYTDGNQVVLANVDRSITTEIQAYEQKLLFSIIFAAATLPILLAVWSLVLAAIRDYIRDREAAAAMAVSRAELLEVNNLLSQEVVMRAMQEESTRSANDILQSDIAHILDVVSALEAGDLTAHGNVNDRATGLVVDTLNRLTESLNRIVSAVVATTYQVTNDAEELELGALETARQAQAQAIEVRSVQSLMENINALTTDSQSDAIATAAAVQQAKSAVLSGREAIEDSTTGIVRLEQSTDQIVKRSQLLTEFVDLAAQFSKDQKRVASLTRVLALNVSTLSSRAIGEKNPEQFASLAKEFETIARQVNDLARDTNQSLVSLQQRTDLVQTVTSGLTQDINEIDLLVQKFTNDIDRSRQAFDNIQSVTERVSQMSEKVNLSSQDIVRVVGDALQAIESISTVARFTEDRANLTQDRVQSMGNLANKLMTMVEFFQLNESILSQSQSPFDYTPTSSKLIRA